MYSINLSTIKAFLKCLQKVAYIILGNINSSLARSAKILWCLNHPSPCPKDSLLACLKSFYFLMEGSDQVAPLYILFNLGLRFKKLCEFQRDLDSSIDFY